jgi:hypothetical protein
LFISCCVALLPFQDQPEVVKAERIFELQERQATYLWKQLPNLPGFVNAQKHHDIPRDSQFSDAALRAFNRGRIFGGLNLALSCIYTIFDRWNDFDCFKKLFTGWAGDVPAISRDDLWMEDRVFGRQFLNGCNPCVIKRCHKLPDNFPVTDKIVQSFLDRGLTLTEEIKVS